MVFLSQSLFSPEISTVSEDDIPALAHRASIRINTGHIYIYIYIYIYILYINIYYIS